MNSLDPFIKKQYLNLETFRKSGEGVRTPVWFCREEEAIYVVTGSSSGKARRIRRNGLVHIAPCKMDGTPTGPWSEAIACEVTDKELIQKVDRLMDKKYGLLKKLFRLNPSHPESTSIVLEIHVRNHSESK